MPPLTAAMTHLDGIGPGAIGIHCGKRLNTTVAATKASSITANARVSRSSLAQIPIVLPHHIAAASGSSTAGAIRSSKSDSAPAPTRSQSPLSQSVV